MKVITEETLKEILTSRVYPEWVIDCLIRNNLKEIGAIHEENGQIIVDDLRPMSDAPRVPVMVVSEHSKTKLVFAYKSMDWDMNREWILFGFCRPVHESKLIGYVPMPIYRPKDGK